MFVSWHAHHCRRQLLEHVQEMWHAAQPNRRGRLIRNLMDPKLPDRTMTEPVKIIRLMLDAFKREEACL